MNHITEHTYHVPAIKGGWHPVSLLWWIRILGAITRYASAREKETTNFKGLSESYMSRPFCYCSQNNPKDRDQYHGRLAVYVKLWVRMRWECRERFPRHRGLVIPISITARCFLNVAGGENVPAIPAHAQPTILRISLEAHGC